MARGLLLAAGTALILAGTLLGAPTWGPPSQISSGERALGPELALNAAGDALVVWDQEVGSECPESPASLSCIHIVQAAARTRGSTVWQTPVEVARPGVGATPRAAIDPAGNAAIVWVHDIGRDRVLQATYRAGLSGTWPEPSDLSVPTLQVRNHHLALDAAGDAVAVWAERADTTFTVQAEVRPATTRAWGAAAALSRPGRNASGGPSIALTPSGRAVVAWIEDGVVRASRGDAATGAWEPPVDLSGSAAFAEGDPQVAVDASGDTAVVWARGNTGFRAVQAVFRPRAGNWTERVEIGTARAAPAAKPQVAVDDSGNVVAMWVGPPGVQAAARPSATGVWSRPVLVSAPNLAVSGLRLAIDASGNAVAVWASGENGVLHAAIRPGASGAWQPQIDLSGSGTSEPGVAMDAAGNAVAVWNRTSAQRVVVESADLDGSGPVLANLRVPKKGTVRVRLTLSVAPVPWAAPVIGAPKWLFGDGRSATGARVAHAYARPGRYKVKVTSTDTLGKATTAARWIRVLKRRA